MDTHRVTAGPTGPVPQPELQADPAGAGGPAQAKASRAAARKPAAAKGGSGASAAGKLGASVDKALGRAKVQKPASARPQGASGAKGAGAKAGAGAAAKGASGTAPKSGAGAASGTTTAGKAGGNGYATTASTSTASGEWAFLQDRSLSVDEKLFRYMMLLQKKADAELEKFMEGTSGAGGSTSSRGSSLFDVVKAVVPGLGLAADLIGEAGLKKLAGQIAGPILAAAATAAGLPALAPAALQFGGSLASLAFQDVGSRATSSSTPTTNEYSNMSDERKALWLQHLLEKQRAMFTAISNALQVMHQTQMAAIQNIR